MVCLPVIDELDEKKSDSRLADRANRSIRDIDRHGGQPGEIRENVSLTIYDESLGSEDLASNTLPDSKDDQIVRVAKKYKRTHPDQEVCIVSEDFGMKVRCRASSIPVHGLDPSERLQNPGEEKDKKVKELQSELVQYKNRLPKLNLALLPLGQSVDDRKPYSVKLTKTWVEQNVDVEVEKRRRDYPKHSDPKKSFLSPGSFAMDYHVKAREWVEYDNTVESYLNSYRNYVVANNLWHKSKELSATVAVVLHNEGTLPATDIDLYICIPKKLEHLSIAGASPRSEPKPPEPPKRPSGFDSIAATLGSQTFLHSYRGVRLPDPPVVRDPHQPKVKIDYSFSAGHRIHIKQDRLKHENHLVLGMFSVGFTSWDDVSPCEVEYIISTSELPSNLEGKIPLIFVKGLDAVD